MTQSSQADLMKRPIIHNDALAQHIRLHYSLDEISMLKTFLVKHGALLFRPIGNGLYPASQPAFGRAKGGYHYVWVRDNVYVAYSHYVNGQLAASVGVVRSLATYFRKHISRFAKIVSSTVDLNEPMNRVHVRFDGNHLEEVPEKWAHAQNDALGYFVWLFCKLAITKTVTLSRDDLELLAAFVAYFRAIRFWEDEDSGHWEEIRKVSASSIGVVIGGLDKLKAMLDANYALREAFESNRLKVDIDLVDELRDRGKRALEVILPAECVQPDRRKRRPFDAALLFLIYPIGVVGREMADQVMTNVIGHLQGEVGIRRYLGDSYWCASYKEFLPPEESTKDFSDDLDPRDALLREGEEAQWCIFDPIISAIHGQRYMESGERATLEQQTFYLNRSLGQINEDLRCPEAYYLEHGRYVPNENTPLLWAEANLWLALKHMEQSLTRFAQ
ncbi:MAG: glycoside hydrolase family 15 protein [Methylocella sp.]